MKKQINKKPADSVTVKTEIVCSNDTNPMGILLGGKLVNWMDIAAAITAQMHAGNICVTAEISKVGFSQSAKVGDVLVIKSIVTRAFNTSMEVYVSVNRISFNGDKSSLIADGYFHFVSIDKKGRPKKVPALLPQSKEEKIAYEAAMKRKMQNKM